MNEETRTSYLNECRQIQQNALYTAQSHHDSAEFFKKVSFWLQLVPAVVAAVTGALVGSGVSSDDLLWLTVAASAVSAVTSVLNPNKEREEHARAAKSFTNIRHDARFLHESQVHTLTGEQFIATVDRLHCRYNDVVGMTPTTGRSVFEKARTFIQSGRHDPDKNTDGTIK